MAKYVKPVSKLHWTFATQAGRAEWRGISSRSKWFEVCKDSDVLMEVLWWFSKYGDGRPRMFNIRIRVED